MSNSLMANKDDFNDNDLLSSYLAKQLTKGRLSIVLGAGISYHFGLPLWDDLVKYIYEDISVDLPSEDHTNENLAEHFRRNHCTNHENYAKAVHKALYRDVDISFSKLRSHDTLAAIGSLVMASRRGNASDVITLNFDNLLELYLKYHGYMTRSIYDDKYWSKYSDVTIYHPHGYLPFNLNEGQSNHLVFDQKSYDMISSEGGSAWRSILYNIMFHRTCLFIGLSGKDANLTRLLLDTNSNHIYQKNSTRYWGITFSTENDPVTAGNWEERGIYYKQINDYDKDLPELLFRICQKAVSYAT